MHAPFLLQRVCLLHCISSCCQQPSMRGSSSRCPPPSPPLQIIQMWLDNSDNYCEQFLMLILIACPRR